MHPSKILLIIFATLWLGGTFCGSARAEHEHPRDLTALASVKTSLAQAIGTVEQQNGGQAVKAEYHERNGVPVYGITVLAGGKEGKTLIDPMSGKILKTAQEGLLSRVFGDDASERAGIKTSKLSLGAAVTMAEKQSGGKVVEADFKDKHGKPRFEVELVKDGTSQEIVIDGVSGQIVKTKAHDDEHDDD